MAFRSQNNNEFVKFFVKYMNEWSRLIRDCYLEYCTILSCMISPWHVSLRARVSSVFEAPAFAADVATESIFSAPLSAGETQVRLDDVILHTTPHVISPGC